MAVITSWGVGVGAAVSLGVGVGIVNGARVGVRVGIDGIGEEVGVVLGAPPAHPGITNSNRSTPISRLNIIDLMRVILIKYPFLGQTNEGQHCQTQSHEMPSIYYRFRIVLSRRCKTLGNDLLGQTWQPLFYLTNSAAQDSTGRTKRAVPSLNLASIEDWLAQNNIGHTCTAALEIRRTSVLVSPDARSHPRPGDLGGDTNKIDANSQPRL